MIQPGTVVDWQLVKGGIVLVDFVRYLNWEYGCLLGLSGGC